MGFAYLTKTPGIPCPSGLQEKKKKKKKKITVKLKEKDINIIKNALLLLMEKDAKKQYREMAKKILPIIDRWHKKLINKNKPWEYHGPLGL